jgi:cytochrome c oxidase assembly factor CtaG
MSGTQLLLSTWQWHPTILAGCAILLVAYMKAVPALSGRSWCYLAGVLVLLFALVSPLDTLGDTYLFSAHMVQHLLLIMVVPPLLLLGLPPELVSRVLALRGVRRVERVLGQPLLAWPLAIGMLWLWHLPPLFNAALTSESIHVVQHLCFLLTATVFWWPVFNTQGSHYLSVPVASLYLFAAAIASSLLGMLLTYVPVVLYAPYTHPIDTLGILPLIRSQWALSPEADQQLGGLLMWVPGGTAYLIVICGLLARWLSEPDPEPLHGIQAGGE